MKLNRFAVAFSALALAVALASQALADPPLVYPLAGLVYQPAQPDADESIAVIVAFAPTDKDSHVERISLVPVDGLLCDATHYRVLRVYDVDAAGAMGTALYTGTTTCADSGTWEAGVAAFSIVLAHDLRAGHSLAAIWRSSGAGVALPSGAWRIE